MDPLVIAAVGFFLVAVVFGFVSQAMKSDTFERNRAIGIRTRTTLASDEAWARGHRASSPWILSTAILAVVCGLAAVTLSLNGAGESDLSTIIVILGGFGSIIACLIVGAVVANRAAATARS